MSVIFYTLLEVKSAQLKPKDYIRIFLENVSFLQAIMCVFAPPIAADWLSSEANKLKLMLHDRLIEEIGK